VLFQYYEEKTLFAFFSILIVLAILLAGITISARTNSILNCNVESSTDTFSPVHAPAPTSPSTPTPIPALTVSPTPAPTASFAPKPSFGIATIFGWLHFMQGSAFVPENFHALTPSPTPTPTQARNASPTPASTPAPTPSPTPTPTQTPSTELKLAVYDDNPSLPTSMPIDSINCNDFGLLYPGQSTTYTVYFRNEGNVPFKLYMSTSDWILRDSAGQILSQSYEQYFTVTWDYDNSVIDLGETIQITFTLAISSSLVDVSTFSFNVDVTAVQ